MRQIVRAVTLTALLCLASAVHGQQITQIDPVLAKQFTDAFLSGDRVQVYQLLSSNAIGSTYFASSPTSEERFPDMHGAVAVSGNYELIIKELGKPVSAKCSQPDGVSLVCDYTFSEPGRGLSSMIMFDGKKVGALMIKYGGAALR